MQVQIEFKENVFLYTTKTIQFEYFQMKQKAMLNYINFNQLPGYKVNHG